MSISDGTRQHATRPVLARLMTAFVAVAALTAGPVAPAVAAPDVPRSFTIKGTGYGHGVGMAQYGAYQMAREGSSAAQILGHYYAGSRTAQVRTPRTIDVQVYGPDPYGYAGYGDSDPTQIVVDGGSWRLLTRGKPVAHGTGPLKVSTSRGNVVVQAEGRTHRHAQMWLQWSGTDHYRPHGSQGVVRVKGAPGSYRWGMLLLTASAGVPNVVNRMQLNTAYLYGIAEMPASWGGHGGGAALEAQAIVARSYATVQIADRKERCRCHVVDDVRDQRFIGHKNRATAASRHWFAAVRKTTANATRAKVLMYDGRPVEAHYFSSSGGRTAHSEEVWRSKVPYERSVHDPYSLRAPGNSFVSWDRQLTQEAARKLFGLRSVASIKVTDRHRSGQAAVLVATSPSGRTSVIRGSADDLRLRVGPHTGAGSMPSAWIKWVRAN